MICIKCHKDKDLKFHRDSKSCGLMKTCIKCTNAARAAKVRRKRNYTIGCYNPNEWKNDKIFI